jgi:hypothetical protein
VIREPARDHVIQEVAFDPWRAGQLAAEPEHDGFACVSFTQSDSPMIPAG